jgi:hypothetical protein
MRCEENVAMAPDPEGDAIYWRTNAKAVRKNAEVVRSPRAKAALLNIADAYDRLAIRAESSIQQQSNSGEVLTSG